MNSSLGWRAAGRPADTTTACGKTPAGAFRNQSEGVPLISVSGVGVARRPRSYPMARIKPFTLKWTISARDGRVFRADVEQTDLETVIADLISGQYRDAIRVVAFNTVEGWLEDVSEDVAREIQRRADLARGDLPSSIEAFVES